MQRGCAVENVSMASMLDFIERKTVPGMEGKELSYGGKPERGEALDAMLDALLEAGESQTNRGPTSVIHLRVVPNRGSGVANEIEAPQRPGASGDNNRGSPPSTEAPSSGTTSVDASAPRYSFPGEGSKSAYPELNNAQLIGRLETLIERHQDDRSCSYAEIRVEFCALSIEMNRRTLMAPRFRRQPKYPKITSKRRPGDDLASNDRQVIDLHWLRCRHFEAACLRAPYKRLFSGTTFDFDLASEFVSKMGSASDKADEYLALARHEQLELAVIQSDAIRQEFANLFNGSTDANGKKIGATRPKAFQRIKDHIHRNHRLHGHARTYIDLWVARELVGDSPTRVREFLKLMTGKEPTGRKSIESKLETLRGILGESLPPQKNRAEDEEEQVPAGVVER